jgi:hypothetical protein
MWSANAGNSDFEQAPTGTELGICIKVIDLGTQEKEYEGKVSHRRQVLITWELPNALMTEGDNTGKPFIVSKFYTASLNEKATLRHHLVSWRGREFTEQELAGFDPQNIIGKPCMLSLVANNKGKTVVSSVMAAPKGMPIPQQVNKSAYFSMYPGKFSMDAYESLSDGIKAIIAKSPEYQELMHPKDAAHEVVSEINDLTDDILF